MRRIDRRRTERLRRRVTNFGVSFALGALVATLLGDRLQTQPARAASGLAPVATSGKSSVAPPPAPAIEAAPRSASEAIGALTSRNLLIPVVGVAADRLVNTFNDSRALGRRHDAIDIMAPVGRPIVAAAPGTVEKLFFSPGGGGTTVYVRSDDGLWSYYYAHLSAYAPGLHEGQRVRRGTPIGYVGFSGNANPAGPHLHFAINRMQPGEKWYQGTAINPYPLLAGRKSGG